MTTCNSQHDDMYDSDESRRPQPSAERRQPQLNGTICGCDCNNRGFVDGSAGGEGGSAADDMERVFFGGDEGAATTGLIDPATLAQAPLFNVGTTFADYDYGHHGFNLGHQRVLIEDPFRSGMPEMALHRIPSGESLVMQLGSSVAPSMSSSGYFSIRPESPSQQIAGIGDWADAAATTTTRSEYFFTQTPLRLVPRVRCCHTETESEDNSSATLFTDGSDFLVDGEDDDASE